MLLGITGGIGSGCKEAVKFFAHDGFTVCEISSIPPGQQNPKREAEIGKLNFSSAADLVAYVTPRWLNDYLVLATPELVETALHLPFFLVVVIEAPLKIRWTRFNKKHGFSWETFIENADPPAKTNLMRSRVTVSNAFGTIEEFHKALTMLNVRNTERLRPSWDAYFMKLAELAAMRSNCMKRRVGCVLVRDRRVVATGYNGTPRGIANCNEGGCPRCNNSNPSGTALATCLCLHAEENALLESGRDRLGISSTLYCNTCPCLTCSIKIVQAGVTSVVYSRSYSMDSQSVKVLESAGVEIRRLQILEFY